jgi:hypothetical protein
VQAHQNQKQQRYSWILAEASRIKSSINQVNASSRFGIVSSFC